jgi:hypothetical protein
MNETLPSLCWRRKHFQFDSSLDGADTVTAWLEGYDTAGHMVVKLVKNEVEVKSLIPENNRVHRPGQWRGQRSVKDN